MSYFVNNVRRVLRDLRALPMAELPGRVRALATPKIKKIAEELAFRTGASLSLARKYRGQGIALMFHEVHADVDAELRTGCDAQQLDRIIRALKAKGRDIVSFDEAIRRLQTGDDRPFALLTFDDGYRDNITNALPVLERHAAPMMLFVPTGMIERSLYAWWLGLRELAKRFEELDVEAMGMRLPMEDLPSKTAAMRRMTSWIGTDQARADAFQPEFEKAGLSIPELIGHYAMDGESLKQFAAHPLVSIGAHTTSHRFLAGLRDEEVEREFAGNKTFLENLLQQPVDVLAYPYGTETSCGQREVATAAKVGMRASFTTRPGQIFPQHLETPHLLPRIDVGYAPLSPSALDARLSGLHRAMTSGFGDPVARLS